MATLSLNQILELADAPANRDKIAAARDHELRMRLHTEPILDKRNATTAVTNFLTWVDGILAEKTKQQRFRQFFTFPIATNDLADKIFTEYPRVLQAYNRYVKNTFTNEAYEDDFKNYLEEISFDVFWENDGMNALRKYINAFVVIDLPAVQVTPRPAPYFYLVQIDQVMSADVSKRGDVEHIIFWQDLTDADKASGFVAKAAAFDDVMVRLIGKKEKESVWQLITEAPHEQPYCPVCKFYPEVVSHTNTINSKSPITDSLGALDKLLFWKISEDYYKSYGAYPIYWGYKQQCTYVDEQTQGSCDGNGQITWNEALENGLDTRIHTKACPACAQRNLMGPGSFIEVDPPAAAVDADLREPVGFVKTDVEALKNIGEDNKTLEARILYNTTGATPTDSQAAKAINQIQVQSTYDSRKAVLLVIKKNLERSMQFVYEALARYRYGDGFVSSTVDLGTDWFLQSNEELNKDYQETKDAGRPSYELGMKREFMLLTKLHNNPEELQRLNIMQNLEPYQDYSVTELQAMGIEAVDKVGFLIKLNFYNFIKRFERENHTSLLQFGALLNFDTRITLILKTLKTYTDEYNDFPATASQQEGDETKPGGHQPPKTS